MRQAISPRLAIRTEETCRPRLELEDYPSARFTAVLGSCAWVCGRGGGIGTAGRGFAGRSGGIGGSGRSRQRRLGVHDADRRDRGRRGEMQRLGTGLAGLAGGPASIGDRGSTWRVGIGHRRLFVRGGAAGVPGRSMAGDIFAIGVDAQIGLERAGFAQHAKAGQRSAVHRHGSTGHERQRRKRSS